MRLWLAAYVAAMLLGGALFGNIFYERADPFEVYSEPGRQALGVGTPPDDELVVRSPLANLDTTVPRAGLVAVLAVLFGSTGFDSFSESTRWVQRHPGHLDLVVPAQQRSRCSASASGSG